MHTLYSDAYIVCVPDRSVWVSDSQQPFVEHPAMSPDVLYMKEKEPLVIPCRVNHPNITTTLVKVSAWITNLLLQMYSESQSARVVALYLHAHVTLVLTCSITPLIVTCPSFFHQASLKSTMHRPVVSPCPDHSPHCSYLGSHYALACVSVCLCPTADMCESVCGYVCECWRLSAEWEGEWTKRNLKLSVSVSAHVAVETLFDDEVGLSVHFFNYGTDFFRSNQPYCWHCFYLWRQDLGSWMPLELFPGQHTSHISPFTSCSGSKACQLSPTDVLNSWPAWQKK